MNRFISSSCSMELCDWCVFYVCLISRARCEGEQWAGGVCSVPGGCPAAADRHQQSPPGCYTHTGSQAGAFSTRGQCNQIHFHLKCVVNTWLVWIRTLLKGLQYAFNGYIHDVMLTLRYDKKDWSLRIPLRKSACRGTCTAEWRYNRTFLF